MSDLAKRFRETHSNMTSGETVSMLIPSKLWREVLAALQRIEELENPWIRADKLFLSSWPNGKLRPVETLGRNPYMHGGIYIRYLDGKGEKDTTTSDFLFDIPSPPKGGE